jgi:hypothetical protein
MMFLTMGIGLFRYMSGSLGKLLTHRNLKYGALQPLTLVLPHAFSSGTTALTDKLSPMAFRFREPRTRNANITLIWMGAILSVLFLSITFLSHQIGLSLETETVISQLV